MHRFRSSLILGALCCFTVLVFYAFLTQNFLPPQRATFFDDFPNYYFAGKRLLDGVPVYGHLEQDVAQSLGVEGYRAYASDTPLAVLALTPVALLSYQTSWWCFIALSVVLFFFAITLWLDAYNFSPEVRMLLLSMSYLSQPFLFLIKKNHFETLLLLLFVCGLRAYKRNQLTLGTLWWGLAAGLKLFPAVWFLALPNQSIVKRVSMGSFAVLLSFLIGCFCLGTKNILDFFVITLPLSSMWQGTVGNYSIISFCTALGIASWGYPLLILCGVAVVLRWRDSHGARCVTALAAAALLLAPLCWLNYFILLIPACIDATYQHTHLRIHATFIRLVLLVCILFYPPSITLLTPTISVILSFVPLFMLLYLAFSKAPLAVTELNTFAKPDLT